MIKKRDEIPAEATWKLEDMVENREAWEKLYEEPGNRPLSGV